MGADHAGIFEAHLLVLDDPEVNNEVLRFIQNDKVNAEFAYQSVAQRYAESLAAIDDDYLRERAAPSGTWLTEENTEHAVGYAALPALALLECGVPPSDPARIFTATMFEALR